MFVLSDCENYLQKIFRVSGIFETLSVAEMYADCFNRIYLNLLLECI